MKRIVFSLIFGFAALFANSQTMAIQVSGNVTFNNSLYSITEAGNDFPSSVVNESSVFVSIQPGNWWDYFRQNKKWRINIQKSDLTWNSNLKLEAIRTGDGSRVWGRGGTNINDGTSYQTITNTSNYFFKGKDEIAYIPINFRLSGVSVTMGAQNFETNVLLTIYDD